MHGPYLRKYGAQTTIDFTLFETDGVNFKTDAAHASGDTKIMKNEGAEANTTNGFTDEGQGYSIVLTATEMQAARIVFYVVDQGTKAWLDTAIVIETYGHASAMHAVDLSDSVRAGLTALPNAAADAAGGLPISDAGELDLDTQLAETNEITAARMGALTDLIDDGRLDLILDELMTQGDTNEGKLDTVAGYLDTEITAILEDTGTTLENHLTDIKGTGFVKDTDSLVDLAHIGADGDTLETLSDQIDTVPTASEIQTEMEENGASVLDTLQDRLTAARAGYLDNLNIGENVAGTSEISGLNDITAANVKTAMEADGGDLSSLMEALVNKAVWTEADGQLEMFNDTNVSQGTIAAQISTDGTFTTRKRALI